MTSAWQKNQVSSINRSRDMVIF